MGSAAWLIVTALQSSPGAATGPPAELRKQAFVLVMDPAALPDAVKAAWAAALSQKQLRVAAPGQDFNSSDAGGGVRHRLILAAVSDSYAVVHFEAGGFALTRRAMAFSRTGDSASLVWKQQTRDAYPDAKTFLSAIRSGRLWRTP